DPRQLQHMGFLGTSSTATLPQSMQSVIRSSYEMAVSGITLTDPRDRSAAKIHFNLMHQYPPQQQQSQAIQKNAYAEASPKVNALSFHAYDARMPERFSSILEGNANYELCFKMRTFKLLQFLQRRVCGRLFNSVAID
ncbi:hypothetical protein KI387_031043, partial [Taxus chinensis]